MTEALAHRGPDADGVWVEGSIALGHRRLSILYLSPAGAQPMHSACGRYVIAFNGEIYNHLDLRQLLQYAKSRARLARSLGHRDAACRYRPLGAGRDAGPREGDVCHRALGPQDTGAIIGPGSSGGKAALLGLGWA